MNAGQWKRTIGRAVNIFSADGSQYQGYLREVRRSRWLVFDVPLPNRDDWRLVVDRHSQSYQFEVV